MSALAVVQSEQEARAALYAYPGSIGQLEALAGIGRELTAEQPALLFWRDVVAAVGNDADPAIVIEEGTRRLRLRVLRRVRAGEVTVIDWRLLS